jgi:hypothetical protein
MNAEEEKMIDDAKENKPDKLLLEEIEKDCFDEQKNMNIKSATQRVLGISQKRYISNT